VCLQVVRAVMWGFAVCADEYLCPEVDHMHKTTV
jgi:hypothetical protein